MSRKKIKKFQKRDGRIIDFDQTKITKAIFKALTVTETGSRRLAKKLSDQVLDLLRKRLKNGEIPKQEEAQDIVEEVLILNDLTESARAYILYREQRRKIRETKEVTEQTASMVDQYLDEVDWEVKENANMAYSLQGLNHYVTSAVTKKYWLNKIYPQEIRIAAYNGDLHIHNLDCLGAYCCGWDLYDLLVKGFGGVSGKVESKPPKHFQSALGQLVNFFYTLQGESAGAQAVSSFDTLLAPFIRYDNLSYKETKQSMQEFLFNCAVPTRVGFQCPFTNITLDINPSPALAKQPVIIGGKPQKETYGEFQEEMDMFNKAFYESMIEGDSKGRPFSFPIPTVNITNEFDWDNPTLKPLWEATAKFGLNYFSNFINSDMKPEDVRSMCCRLRLDNKDLLKRGGGLFGSNPLTGCYDQKTEILTENGWKFFKDLSKKDSVFTLTEDNEVEIHKPKKLFEYDYQGQMYQFITKSLDLLVTPNHRMVIDQTGSNKRKFIEAQDFDYNNHRIPKQSNWRSKEEKYFILPGIEITKYGRQGRTPYKEIRDTLKIEMDNWLKFFGFWLAEGSTDNENIAKSHGYRTVITQVNKKKREEIKKVLDILPFNYAIDKNNFVICNKQLWVYLRPFGKKYDKFIPEKIKKLGKRQLKILFDWMIKGDGHIRKTNGQINYWTTSKRLADDLQEVILKLGWLGTLSTQKRKISQIKGRVINVNAPCYVLGVQKAKHYRLRKNNIRKLNYKGKVYCCEVKNHTLFVRRNGKVTWCGNSIGVVTINMPRLGYLSKTKKDFFERLARLMDLAKESLDIKRKALEDLSEKGLYPYSKFYLEGVKKIRGQYWGNHFSTIGLLGLNESCLNFISKDIGTLPGKKFATEVLDFMRERLVKYQKENDGLYNLEATPAEGTSYRLAKKDKEIYPDIIVANEKAYKKQKAAPFYTNSSQLPVDYTDDLFKALELQDDIQTKYTGGCVKKETEVITNYGIMVINDIVNDFKQLKDLKVITYNEKTGQTEWKPVEKAIYIDVAKANKIKIKFEKVIEITTSDWHPFYVLEKNKAKDYCPICRYPIKNIKAFAGHLKSNEDCRKAYREHIRQKPYLIVEKRADQIKVNDKILQVTNAIKQGEKGDKDLLWLTGYYIADGSCSVYTDNRGGNNIKKYYVRFNDETRETLERAKGILNKRFGCQLTKIQKDKRGKNLILGTTQAKTAEYFKQFGEGLSKGYTTRFTNELKNYDYQTSLALLAGVIDGDGHIDKKQYDCEISTVSYGLAKDIEEILYQLGILPRLSKKTSVRENEVPIYRICISKNELLKIKNDLANYITNPMKLKRLNNLPKQQRKWHPVTRVKSISKLNMNEDTFCDLMVKDNHNYLAGEGGFVFVHNTVLHGFIGERLANEESVKILIKKVFEKFKLPYFTLTPTFSICPTHGYIVGEHFTCPKCVVSQPCEVYSRIVGYLRPVQQWNNGKKQEFKQRKNFKS